MAARRGPAHRARRPLWRIAEPTTTLTDLALAALATALGLILLRRGMVEQAVAVQLWSGAFLTTAASALLGAVVHGFAPWLSAAGKGVLWRATLVLIGATNFLLVSAVVVAELGGPARAVLLVAAVAKLLLFLDRLRTRDDFAVAATDSGVSLLVVLGLALYGAVVGSSPGAPWIVGGVLLSLVGAGVQRSGWSLHRHFNHNDLFHLVQMGAAYLLFRGGVLLQ